MLSLLQYLESLGCINLDFYWGENWGEINDVARGTYNTNSQIKFKTSMLQWSLYDYNDVYIIVSEIFIVAESAVGGGK